jgi:hypothetical protein
MKPIIKKTIVRIVKSGTYQTVQYNRGKITKGPFLDYKDAVKQGYAMTRKQSQIVIAELCKTITKEGITALVVFFDDPQKEISNTLKKKSVKKRRC